MFFPIKLNHSFLIGLSLTSGIAMIGIGAAPASAITWNLVAGSEVQTLPISTPLTGSFAIDNENSPSASVTFSNVTLGALTFTAGDVINLDFSGGVNAIDWLDANNNVLSLAFNTPLTTSGGTVFLNPIVSSFTNSNGELFNVTGTVFAVPWETDALPILGSSLLLGGAVLLKRKLSKSMNQ